MEKRLYKSPDKKLCGVCAGVADYFNTDPTLIRLLVLLLSMFSFGMIAIAYFVCAIAIENPHENYFEIYHNTSKKIMKSPNKKLCGVCGGIAERLNIDPVIVRIIWGLLTVFTVGIPGIIVYFVASAIMPDDTVSTN